MSDAVTKKGVAGTAAENGLPSSSEAAVPATVTLTLGERTSPRVARTRARLAAGRAAGQTDRSALRGSTSSRSEDRCPVPGSTRTAERALSSHCKKEKTMPAKLPPTYVGLDI